MRSFTFDSDKRFLLAFLAFSALLATGFYFFVQSQAVFLAAQKKDDHYNYFVNLLAHEPLEMAYIGTSHAEQWTIIGEPLVVALTAPHTIPTVMYFKAKAIIKYHPEIKAVYLEADDHLFFNGTYYTLDGFTPEQKRNSKVFQWCARFIDGDEEAKEVFGEVAPPAGSPRLLLQEDVKPIVIKRIMANLLAQHEVAPPVITAAGRKGASCDFSQYPKDVDLSGESPWSARTQQDKDARMAARIKEHNLDQPGPMKESMLVYYEKTIKLLQDHHIDVILVLNPEFKAFEALKNPQGQKLHQEFLRGLADKYKLRILDFRGLSKYGERIFEDQDHLAAEFGWLVGKAVMQDFCSEELGRKAIPAQ